MEQFITNRILKRLSFTVRINKPHAFLFFSFLPWSRACTVAVGSPCFFFHFCLGPSHPLRRRWLFPPLKNTPPALRRMWFSPQEYSGTRNVDILIWQHPVKEAELTGTAARAASGRERRGWGRGGEQQKKAQGLKEKVVCRIITLWSPWHFGVNMNTSRDN